MIKWFFREGLNFKYEESWNGHKKIDLSRSNKGTSKQSWKPIFSKSAFCSDHHNIVMLFQRKFQNQISCRNVANRITSSKRLLFQRKVVVLQNCSPATAWTNIETTFTWKRSKIVGIYHHKKKYTWWFSDWQLCICEVWVWQKFYRLMNILRRLRKGRHLLSYWPERLLQKPSISNLIGNHRMF